MALSLLNSVCSLATKLTATIPSSPSSSSSPSLLSPTPAVKEDLEKLHRTLRRIQAVLADAERREVPDESVKLWVKELKGVAYDAEDVLEEYQHELLRIQVESRVASAEATRKRKRVQEEQQVVMLRESKQSWRDPKVLAAQARKEYFRFILHLMKSILGIPQDYHRHSTEWSQIFVNAY